MFNFVWIERLEVLGRNTRPSKSLKAVLKLTSDRLKRQASEQKG